MTPFLRTIFIGPVLFWLRARVYLDSTRRDFRTSRQWMAFDDLPDEGGRRIGRNIGERVDLVIAALDIWHRIAVNTAVRNVYVGRVIFVNPRYPAAQDADYEEWVCMVWLVYINKPIYDGNHSAYIHSVRSRYVEIPAVQPESSDTPDDSASSSRADQPDTPSSRASAPAESQ